MALSNVMLMAEEGAKFKAKSSEIERVEKRRLGLGVAIW